MNNIEELFELINPELITSEKTLIKEMEKANRNKNAINNYLLACVHRLAKLKRQKVFAHEVTYSTIYSDYYVEKDRDKVEIGPSAVYSEIIDYGDGNWEENSIKEVADYTKKEI